MWKKLGLVYTPNSENQTLFSHAQLPVVHIKDEEHGDLRVFFASRSAESISYINYVDFNIHSIHRINHISETPVLAPGDIGCFDQFGVYPASILKKGNDLWLYYIGWVRGVEQPLFYAGIGLAVSRDSGNTFSKFSSAPILDRGESDPCLVTSPNVYAHLGKFHMNYVSGIRWIRTQEGKLKSFYNIKYATSVDGIDWKRAGKSAIDFFPGESNIARPSVLLEDGIFKMWYCYLAEKNLTYRIGYAESVDGTNWVRKDHLAGIDVSTNGFDNQMICYPNVFNVKGRKYLLYNGNSYGKEGFALAIWE